MHTYWRALAGSRSQKVKPPVQLHRSCVARKAEDKFAVKAFKLRGVSRDKKKELESEAAPRSLLLIGDLLGESGHCAAAC